MKKQRYFFLLLILILPIISQPSYSQQPTVSKMERDKGKSMLKTIKADIKKHYYDEKFHGIDLEARFKVAEEKIEAATSVGQIMGIIAQVLVEFEDSHTRFVPPQKVAKTEYGWKMQMIGDRALVTAVKPNSDAEKKGLKVGDEVLEIDGFGITRENLWKINYFYYSLRPRPAMKLLVTHPDGKEEELIINAKITGGKKVLNLTEDVDFWKVIRESESEAYLRRHRYIELDKKLFIWKMPAFDLSEADIDELMEKVKKFPALILDLRGNGGGAIITLNRLIGHFFDRDIKVSEWKGRKEIEPQIAKTRGEKYFKGKVVVLIDSESGSSSEIFSRVMQLEKRGIVIGDRSAGAVMVSRYYQRQLGVDTVTIFGTSITYADVIMSDGKSLEKVGVIPDERILVSGQELASQKDPVLSRAAAILEVSITPETAGKMFALEWEQ